MATLLKYPSPSIIRPLVPSFNPLGLATSQPQVPLVVIFQHPSARAPTAASRLQFSFMGSVELGNPTSSLRIPHQQRTIVPTTSLMSQASQHGKGCLVPRCPQ